MMISVRKGADDIAPFSIYSKRTIKEFPISKTADSKIPKSLFI
jgi:hypothetical protein